MPGLDGERPITVHRAGGFTGELTMISGRQVLALWLDGPPYRRSRQHYGYMP